MVKRIFDLIFGALISITFIIPIIIIACLVKLTSNGPSLYWSDRIGVNNKLFKMPKFRSMKIDTPVVATDLLVNPDDCLTSIGGFLRKTSLDELPQILCILKGEMSFVGPRPALFNQYDLIAGRTRLGIDKIKPGLTGWAQINGRDELALTEKIRFDAEYLQRQSFRFDLAILWLTFLKVSRRESVSH
jgi:O-antigen biosynthesis protein WbqP